MQEVGAMPFRGLLLKAYPRSYIVIVRPARMERATFSCYDNFVTSNSVGSPEHSDDAGAVPHLSLLLRGLEVVNIIILIFVKPLFRCRIQNL